MRLYKDIEFTMETLFLINKGDARKLLLRDFNPFTFWGRGLLQLGALKYRDLKFEGAHFEPILGDN